MIPNGYLIFEDESFLDSTVAKMNALRKSGQFCDVRLQVFPTRDLQAPPPRRASMNRPEHFSLALQVCGHELMAHRAVLACCSPYLFEIFNSDNEPHGVSHVTFEDLDPEAVEILLNYAYTAQSVAPLAATFHFTFFFPISGAAGSVVNCVFSHVSRGAGSRQTRSWSRRFTLQPKGSRWTESNRFVSFCSPFLTFDVNAVTSFIFFFCPSSSFSSDLWRLPAFQNGFPERHLLPQLCQHHGRR